MIIRRTFIAVGAAILAVAAAPATWAQDYPSKPITIVVGYAAGGPTDVLARTIGQRLSDEWKQPVIVENRTGANEAVAAQAVAKAPNDGYTILFATEGPLTQNQFLFSKLAYSPENDFAPISLVASSPLVLVVPSNSPVNTLEEFVALAQSRAKTKPLMYGSAGLGGVIHLPMAMLSRQNNLEMIHVPYKGTAPLFPDLISGQVDAAFISVSGAAPFIRDGKVKALVIDNKTRLKSLPQVPTFAETKVKRVQADLIYALMAPAGTPPAIVEKLGKAVKAIVTDPAFNDKYLEPNGYVVVGSTPKELGDYLVKDRVAQEERIKVSGAKLD